MLGRLLHATTSSLNPAAYGRNVPILESTTEEEHTRNLLFPDASLLQHTSHAYPLQNGPPSPLASNTGGYDDRGGLELDANKDLRVIIAQDALGDQDEPCVLLDTQTPADLTGHAVAPGQNPAGRGSPRHRRGASIVHGQALVSPTSPTQSLRNPPSSPAGAFFKPRIRSATISLDETDSSQSQQDARDDTKTLLNCMFGSSLIGHKGTSTKMHILNADGAPVSPASAKVPTREGDGSTRKDGRQRQQLSRAHTYGAQPRTLPSSHTRTLSGLEPPTPQKEAVLLTRVFAVNLPEPAESDATAVPSTPGVQLDASYPFPDMGNGPNAPRKARKLKEKKTPVYAVAIIVRLPPTPKVLGSRPSSRRASQAPMATSTGSFSSSLGSELPSSWTFLDAFPIPAVRALADSIDARVDALAEHWDFVTRTLSTLERQASQVILRLLQERDAALQVPMQKTPKEPKEKSMQRTNQRIVQLMPYALFPFRDLKDKALHAAMRLCFALRIPKVLTGQSRWSIWQDEARWIGRWAGGRDQNFFFFTLLTAFLGIHTEWLAQLGPEWYRVRYARQRKSRSRNELVPARTVIVCSDKMAARRLIFLLSSFLPSLTRKETVSSPLRPTTSSTHSPPIGHNVSRQPSLRRTVNRRAMDNRLAAGSFDKRDLSASVSSNEGEAFDHIDDDASEHRLLRIDSDSRSTRTTKLALPANDLSTRKSSAATTTTITPTPTTPIAHFATGSSALGGDYFSQRGRENSSDSSAEATLAVHLKQHDNVSASFDSDKGSGRWGSLLSGIWSSKYDSSADTSTTLLSVGNANSQKRHGSPTRRLQSHLAQMADEVGRHDDDPVRPRSGHAVVPNHPHSRPSSADRAMESPTLSHSGTESMPVKLMVDETDGVVDVGIDVPGFFSSSVGSSINSPPPPSGPRTSSLTSVDGMASFHSHGSTSNLSSSMTIENQSNVAGWLRQYHEDFILQAVRHSPDLSAQIHASMSAEPTPNTQPSDITVPNGEKWVDVSTTLVADARNFTIKRMTLRRQVQTQSSDNVDLKTNGLARAPAPRNISNQAATRPAETLVIEPVMDMDATLIDAVERVVARSTHPSRSTSPIPGSSRNHSRTPSVSTTMGPNANTSAASISNSTPTTIKDTLPTTFEVSRGECRKVITTALRDAARSVNDELNRKVGGRDIRGGNGTNGNCNAAATATTGAAKDKARPLSKDGVPAEENTLREGIRKWLVAVERAEGY